MVMAIAKPRLARECKLAEWTNAAVGAAEARTHRLVVAGLDL